MSTNPALSTEEPIAIVGMACIFPGAPDLATYWANILNGVDAVGEAEPGWGAQRYLADGRIATARGGFLGDLYRFAPEPFGIMPRSLDGGEPDQYLALEVARAALVDAGYADGNDHFRTGIILGHSTYLHRGNASVVQHGVVLDQTVDLLSNLFPQVPEAWLGELRRLLAERLPPFNADIAPGLVPNVMTGRIANRLDLRGPNYLIDAACASSLLAVGAAMEELRRGRCDLMLAGGVNASLPAEVSMVFTTLGALSTTGCIRPFSAEANGTLLGEGLGILVLKRLGEAERDGDRIYASLLAVGQSSDGRGTGLLAPRVEGEKLAIARSYHQSGVDPARCGLIEAHGTGIPLGDRTEIQALTLVLGHRARELPHCALGSVKSMISHCLPAAGAAGLIKTALALYHRILPPTLCENVNPDLGLEISPLYVNNRTRPWIHGGPAGRVAGVDAFGFGGINTHALLCEGPEAKDLGLQDWPCELILMAGNNPAALCDQIRILEERLAASSEALPTFPSLAAELAYTAIADGARLSIVAHDYDDLANKLVQARQRLENIEGDRFQSRNGIFFSSRRITGRLAYVFPGEGSQYPGMLAELACLFPEVRLAFDEWDSVAAGMRELKPSEVVYPPPTGLTSAQVANLEERLYSMELGSEAMFFASRALLALAGTLGIHADAMVGHSSGEHGALLAAGAVLIKDPDALASHIRELNALYRTLAASDTIVKGALLTVGAVDRSRILALIDGSDGALHLALDNCLHQAVLFGLPEAIAAAAEVLRGEGGLCSILPMDRAYHTPLFQAVAQAVEAFYQSIPVGSPQVPLYSCAMAEPFPGEPAAIRALAAGQWASRVRFVETIERMYSDGVRVFIEVGPSSTLTGFIRDILRDREHLALALDQRQRGGLEHLMQVLGRLFVNQRRFDLTKLYQRRGLPKKPGQPRPTAPRLANTLPYVRLAPEEIVGLGHKFQPPGDIRSSSLPVAEFPTGIRQDLDDIMLRHLTLMGEFLRRQPSPLDYCPPPIRGGPLIDRILMRDDGRVEAKVLLDVARQRFLRHHILYASQVSNHDPELHGLAVLPLAVSLELLVEIAAQLRCGGRLMSVEKVKALDWITFEHGFRTLHLIATSLEVDGSHERFHAQICTAAAEGVACLVEGEVLFSTEEVTPLPSLPPLRAPQAPRWRDEDLYKSGMFHGPLFRSIRSLMAWDDKGLDVELAETPLDGFLERDMPPPDFWINPVLLDAVGHLTAFWIAQDRGTDFSSFPSRIDLIQCIDPRPNSTRAGVLRGRLAFLEGERFLLGDYEAVDDQGRTLLRISGWQDRFFSVPHRFYLARTNPLHGWYGEEIAHRGREGGVSWAVPPFPPGFLEDSGGIWARVLAHALLSRPEREEWAALSLLPRQRQEWLLSRIALKEVTRVLWWRCYGHLLFPADVHVLHAADGGFLVLVAQDEGLVPGPMVSLFFEGHWAVAIASQFECEPTTPPFPIPDLRLSPNA